MRILRALMSKASIGKLVDHYSRFSPSPLSMKQFLDFGELCTTPGSKLLSVRYPKLSVIVAWLFFFFASQVQKMRVRGHRLCSWEGSCQSGWPTSWRRLTCCLITYSGRLQFAWCRAGESTPPHGDTHTCSMHHTLLLESGVPCYEPLTLQ